jgi:hypothetical protein
MVLKDDLGADAAQLPFHARTLTGSSGREPGRQQDWNVF